MVKVYVLVFKNDTNEHNIGSVFVTKEKAERHAKLVNTLGGSAEVKETILVGA